MLSCLRVVLSWVRRRPASGPAVLVLGLAAMMPSAPTRAQTLWEAMAQAYQSHPALGAQRANVRALDADVDGARGGWRPTVAATTGTGRYLSTTQHKALPDPVTNHRTTTDVRVTASQPLLNWSAGPAIEAARA